MANAVIATSHASLASGVYSAVKMIAGKFENLKKMIILMNLTKN